MLVLCVSDSIDLLVVECKGRQADGSMEEVRGPCSLRRMLAPKAHLTCLNHLKTTRHIYVFRPSMPWDSVVVVCWCGLDARMVGKASKDIPPHGYEKPSHPSLPPSNEQKAKAKQKKQRQVNSFGWEAGCLAFVSFFYSPRSFVCFCLFAIVAKGKEPWLASPFPPRTHDDDARGRS